MWPGAEHVTKKERKETWVSNICLYRLHPRALPPQKLSCGVGSWTYSQPCQVSPKSVEGFRFWLLEGMKSAIFLCLSLCLMSQASSDRWAQHQNVRILGSHWFVHCAERLAVKFAVRNAQINDGIKILKMTKCELETELIWNANLLR